MLAKKHPELKKAVDAVKHFSLAERWERWGWDRLIRERRKSEARQILIDAREAALAEGLAEGLAKGLETGLAKGKTEGLETGLAKGMAEGLETGLAKGMAEGLETGLAKGKAESILEIARKMKEMGLPDDQINKATGLSINDIT